MIQIMALELIDLPDSVKRITYHEKNRGEYDESKWNQISNEKVVILLQKGDGA